MTKIKQHFDSFIIEKDEPKMTLRLIFNVDTEVSARDNLEALVEEYRKNGKATAVFGSNEGVNRVEVTLSEGKDDEEFARIIEDGLANGFEQVETVPVSDENAFVMDAGDVSSALDDFITDVEHR